jgi:hypothetical protein
LPAALNYAWKPRRTPLKITQLKEGKLKMSHFQARFKAPRLLCYNSKQEAGRHFSALLKGEGR